MKLGGLGRLVKRCSRSRLVPLGLLTVPKHHMYRIPMNFEEQIREVCQRFVACESDEEAAELSRQMKALLHGKIEELRGDWSRVSQRTPLTVVE